MRNSREVNSISEKSKCYEVSPNNQSSSSHFLHLNNSSDELGQSHLTTFSIRDYAFSNRTKNIQKSWPFSSKTLQLCLKHGLSDPLPPIQPLSSIASHPLEPRLKKKPTISHVEAISCKRLASNDHETKQGFESGSKSKTQATNVNKTHKKKCGLLVKPGACVDSESMALRTCPICKTFSSASNTTLNAHIDQCLSVDSGEQLVSKPNKSRNKPRMKVKTMVDIYAAAKACTLEELDKRNGTKWAVVSSYSNRVVSDNNKPEVSNKGKKKRSVLRVHVDEDAAGIGPVYIDAKGQKLRIISEFKEKASDPSREHVKVNEKQSSSEGKGSYKRCKRRLQRKKYYCKRNASEVIYGTLGMETRGPRQRRNENKKERNICDQPSADPLVLRGPSHVSTDLSEAVSSPLSSWRSCGESQVSGKSWGFSWRKRTNSASFVANGPVDKSVMKLKKARFDVSENEEEDSGRWESEMTQERGLADYDDWDEDEETGKVFRSSSTSTSGEDNDDETLEETGNHKTDDADVEFESMVYENNGCETEEPGSSFMEIDPIPIPGPPGSFLQSPWDMETDATATENNGEFSVITSHVQSFNDQFDLTDRNLSESPVSAVSNFAAPETQTFSLHNITEKSPSGFKSFRQPPTHMSQQDLDPLSKSVPTLPSNSKPVLRLMGKDLMVINQREENSHGDSSLKPTSQFHQDLSKIQQEVLSPHLHHPPYGGNGLYLNNSTSFYKIP